VKREIVVMEMVLGHLVHLALLDHQAEMASMAQLSILVKSLDHLDPKGSQEKMALEM